MEVNNNNNNSLMEEVMQVVNPMEEIKLLEEVNHTVLQEDNLMAKQLREDLLTEETQEVLLNLMVEAVQEEVVTEEPVEDKPVTEVCLVGQDTEDNNNSLMEEATLMEELLLEDQEDTLPLLEDKQREAEEEVEAGEVLWQTLEEDTKGPWILYHRLLVSSFSFFIIIQIQVKSFCLRL